MTTEKSRFQFLPFVICIAIPICVGFVGSLLTMESVKTWYTTINKPSFNPPNGIFGPVWTSLFILMGIASYLVWKQRKTSSRYYTAAMLYLIQLVFNLGWSFLFFYQQQIGLALVEIIILLALIIATAVNFYKINKVAGWLFVPYILWVSFASYLTYSIYILN
ncbi:TspO/MBR family protein [Pedobacter namyangjuensis]|uniref:TspO/MBR family protein n=1 Tax=Pedobacter namyangjuensis TaxID=600626 RepID=UPI000DE2BEBF|nr:TspO/MBR family protein [Pedobacter namyangjuensis]